MNQNKWIGCGWACLLLGLITTVAFGDDEKQAAKPATLTLGREGNVVLQAPPTWKAKKPRFNMIDYEFEAPAAKTGESAARVTIMGAGGDVKSNIERWKGQFQEQGRKLTTKQLKIAGQDVHIVDISGTYMDRPAGPMMRGKATPLKNYRVLGAIMVTDYGRYYIKMYGAQKTVTANEKAFHALVKSLTIK